MNEEIKDKNEEEYFIGRDGKEKEPPAKTRTRVKTKLTHSLPAKVTAFFLMVVFVFSAAGCVLGAVAMIYVDFYTQSESRVRQKLFDDMAYNDGWAMLYSYLSGETEYPASYCEDSNIGFEVTGEGVSYFTGNVDRQSALVFEYDYNLDITENSEQFVKDYTVKIYLDESFAHTDKYSFYADIIRIGYGMRYAVYVIGALSVLSSVALFIFLMCAAGHKAGREDIAVRGMAKLPFDLYTGIYTLIVFLVLYAINRMYYGETAWIIAITLGAPALIILATVYFMNFAVRLKLGGWWKNTVIYYLFALAWKIVKALCRAVRAFIRGLPLVWKTALTWCALSLLTFIGLMIYSAGARLLLWFIANLLLFPAIIYIALTLRKLQNASAALSDGNLSYQVDTRNMLWDFKRAGENMNSIALGMNKAVEERMKSERFKTELITNVSHDIKTPLTSIINYADLIGREETDNEKIKEYAAILTRQSARLKKLIEDLVEASKASSGAVSVNLAPCEAGVLLEQAAGEYEHKLNTAKLTLVITKPELPVTIMADGRLMWRVFDNLMNNICKYAQSGTRVYISLKREGNKALITFKNTSRDPLNITAEELTERFVRGDSSRNSEGNGLGLSIAKSFTELQHGALNLAIDGDLFKVILVFETMK